MPLCLLLILVLQSTTRYFCPVAYKKRWRNACLTVQSRSKSEAYLESAVAGFGILQGPDKALNKGTASRDALIIQLGLLLKLFQLRLDTGGAGKASARQTGGYHDMEACDGCQWKV